MLTVYAHLSLSHTFTHSSYAVCAVSTYLLPQTESHRTVVFKFFCLDFAAVYPSCEMGITRSFCFTHHKWWAKQISRKYVKYITRSQKGRMQDSRRKIFNLRNPKCVFINILIIFPDCSSNLFLFLHYTQNVDQRSILSSLPSHTVKHPVQFMIYNVRVLHHKQACCLIQLFYILVSNKYFWFSFFWFRLSIKSSRGDVILI